VPEPPTGSIPRGRKGQTLSPHGLDPGRKLPFVCLGSECPNTCCGPFHGTRALESALTQADLGHELGEPPVDGAERTVNIFAEIRLTVQDIERLQDAGLDSLIVRRGSPGRPGYYMRLLPDGTCAALSPDKLCSIHPHRPTLCRAFPFYVDLFAGLSLVSSCPGVGAGEQTVKELKPEIQAAIDMYEFWLEQMRQPAKGDRT
jgi:Fe-S-cluster containining protein